jgi:hypothetical protein
MTETIKVEVDEALAKRFRKRAMELYGYKKESMKKALEDTMKRFSIPGRVDWHSMKGVLKGTKANSVQLQHKIWSKDEIKKTRPRLRGVTSETIARQMRNERHGGKISRRKRTRRAVRTRARYNRG